MSREKMLSWLDRIKSRKIGNGSSANKDLGILESILDENQGRGKCVLFGQENVEFEIFDGGRKQHEFVEVELKSELRKKFALTAEENFDVDTPGQLTKVKTSEILSNEEARIDPARTRLSSCKRALKKFLNSPRKNGLFLSPGKNKKTRLVNEEAIEPETSNLRSSRDSGWEEMTSLCSSLSSLPIEEDTEDFWTSSPFCRGKGGQFSSQSSSSVEQEKSLASIGDKIVKNLSRVPSQRGVRTMLKFGNANSVSYRRLTEPSKKSLSCSDVEASTESTLQQDKCLRRKSDSDVLFKATRRSIGSNEYNSVNNVSGNLRSRRRDSFTEFLLGDVVGAKFEQIATIFPDGSVNDEVEESRSRGERRLSADSSSSTSEFSDDSLEVPSKKKLAPIPNERLDELSSDCMGRVRDYRRRISHSDSAPELFHRDSSFGSEDEIEHFTSVDNLLGVLSRREEEEGLVEGLENYGAEEDPFSRSYSCLEEDYTIDMNNSSYIITMYV